MNVIQYVKENLELNETTKKALKEAKKRGITLEFIIKKSKRANDLLRFEGIGPKTVDDIKNQITNLKFQYMQNSIDDDLECWRDINSL